MAHPGLPVFLIGFAFVIIRIRVAVAIVIIIVLVCVLVAHPIAVLDLLEELEAQAVGLGTLGELAVEAEGLAAGGTLRMPRADDEGSQD